MVGQIHFSRGLRLKILAVVCGNRFRDTLSPVAAGDRGPFRAIVGLTAHLNIKTTAQNRTNDQTATVARKPRATMREARLRRMNIMGDLLS